MRLVEDRDGRRFALVKRSGSSSLLLDLETGQRTYRENLQLTAVDGDGPLDRGADEEIAGLIDILEDGPVPIREVIDRTTVCESDLYAIRRELEVADVLTEVEVDGERCWVLAGDDAGNGQS